VNALDRVRELMETYEGTEQGLSSLRALTADTTHLGLWYEDAISREDFDRLAPEQQWAILVASRLVPDFLDERNYTYVHKVAEQAHEECIDWVEREIEAQDEETTWALDLEAAKDDPVYLDTDYGDD
jgi:hypothetical protein